MTVTAMGRVSVATPGTAVALSTLPVQEVSKVFFQVIPGLTGKAYVGKKGLNRTTLAGVIRVLWPNASGGLSDSFFLETDDNTNTLNLSEYYIDMDVAGEGLLVSYWTD